MLVELKQITEQLGELLALPENLRVAAVIGKENLDSDVGVIIGWRLVDYDPETGNITPHEEKYDNLKELIAGYSNEILKDLFCGKFGKFASTMNFR